MVDPDLGLATAIGFGLGILVSALVIGFLEGGS